jgi:ATP-dependent Clp protease ATP-binding subunit ClpA
VIQNKIEDPLSDKLLAGEFQADDDVLIDAEDGEIVLRSASAEHEDEAQEALPAG